MVRPLAGPVPLEQEGLLRSRDTAATGEVSAARKGGWEECPQNVNGIFCSSLRNSYLRSPLLCSCFSGDGSHSGSVDSAAGRGRVPLCSYRLGSGLPRPCNLSDRNSDEPHGGPP